MSAYKKDVEWAVRYIRASSPLRWGLYFSFFPTRSYPWAYLLHWDYVLFWGRINSSVAFLIFREGTLGRICIIRDNWEYICTRYHITKQLFLLLYLLIFKYTIVIYALKIIEHTFSLYVDSLVNVSYWAPMVSMISSIHICRDRNIRETKSLLKARGGLFFLAIFFVYLCFRVEGEFIFLVKRWGRWGGWIERFSK